MILKAKKKFFFCKNSIKTSVISVSLIYYNFFYILNFLKFVYFVFILIVVKVNLFGCSLFKLL